MDRVLPSEGRSRRFKSRRERCLLFIFSMLKISSRDNRKIKFARKVRDGLEKDLIFLEGVRLCEEILRSEISVADVFFVDGFLTNERAKSLIDNFRAKTENICEVEEKVFNSIASTKNPQGVIAVCQRPETSLENIEISLKKADERFPLVILLHQINNPNNLGAILRTAEAVDAAGVILTNNSADVFSPKTSRSAMGANLRLSLWTNADFYEAIDWAKKNDLLTVCADVKAEKSYTEIDWKKPRLLIFGSEAHGLSSEERNLTDENLFIPMENNVESLNLAVSCAVILYEAKRQQTAIIQNNIV